MGYSPQMLAELLAPFRPSGDSLLQYLGPKLDEELLSDIADADYGCEFKENLWQLEQIAATGKVPVPLLWNPAEVLCLMRHGEPTGNPAERSWWRRHLQRAFCCAVLIRAGGDPGSSNMGWAANELYTLAQLVWSALALGPEVQALTGSLLAWRVLAETAIAERGVDRDRLYFVVGLLILAAALGQDEDRIYALLDWLGDEEQQLRTGESWSSGLGLYALMLDETWRSLCQRLAAESPIIASHRTRVALATLVRVLAPEYASG